MIPFIFALFFLALRIVLVGSERIFLSKNNLGKYNSVIVASVFFLGATLLLLPALLLVPNESFSNLEWIKFSLISSIFYAIGFYSYVKALSIENSSLIAPLYNFGLFWLFLLSSMFLDDFISPYRVLGALIMFVGFFFLYSGSITMKISKIQESKGSLIMIFGSSFLAIGRIIDSYAITVYPTTDIILYSISFNFFTGFYLLIVSLLLIRKLQDFKKIFREEKTNLFYASVANGWAYLFLLVAILGLDVTVAEPASLLSIFVTAFLAKKFLNEEVKERVPGTIIIFLGSILLFLDKLI